MSPKAPVLVGVKWHPCPPLLCFRGPRGAHVPFYPNLGGEPSPISPSSQIFWGLTIPNVPFCPNLEAQDLLTGGVGNILTHHQAGAPHTGVHIAGGHPQNLMSPYPVSPNTHFYPLARTPPTATTASTPSRSITPPPASRCRASRGGVTCGPAVSPSSVSPPGCPSPTSTAR